VVEWLRALVVVWLAFGRRSCYLGIAQRRVEAAIALRRQSIYGLEGHMARVSSGIKRKRIRRLCALLATAATSAGILFFVAPASAWALGPGKSCMYLAPSGASGLGHVGWEVQEPGKGYWAGSTEQGTGNPSDSWIVFATSETTIHNDFKYALSANGKVQHSSGYYLYYRCHSTTTSAVGAAIAEARSLETGYNLLNNNCLTKSVAIFTTYWGGDNLQSGFLWGPNGYFYNYLPTVNWGPIHDL
jgi:hypothetical protein